jgi:FkbM family methyltransferase
MVHTFKHGDYILEYDQANLYGLVETYVLDIYRTMDLLKIGDVVVDIGAGIGDFAVLASRKASKVLAIEPNHDDYLLLERNLRNNGCNNVDAVEKGVAAREGLESIKFGDREYSFTTDRLASIVQESKISEIDFLKMDIEGYETQVLEDSIDIVGHCRVIAIEMHGTKKAIDDILLPLGFVFAPLQKNRIYRRILMHPFVAFSAYQKMKRDKSQILKSMLSLRGPEITAQNWLVVGHYIKQGI